MKILRLQALALLCTITSSLAQFTWNGGGGDDNFTTGANWGGTAPTATAATNVLIFDGATRPTPNVDTTSFDFQTLRFAAGASSFDIGGLSLEANGGSANIDQLSAAGQTISSTIDISNNNTTVQGSGLGVLSLTNVQFNAAKGLIVNRDVTIGTISGDFTDVTIGGGATLSLGTQAGTGLFINNQTGSGSAVLLATAPAAWGAGIGLSGTTTLVLGGSNNMTFSGSVVLTNGNADRTLSITNTGTTMLSGTVNLNGGANATRALILDVAGTAGEVTLSGKLQNGGANAGGITKTNAGTLVLNNNTSDYTGTTTIGRGTLIIEADNALGATNGGTVVAGNGTDAARIAFRGDVAYSAAEPLTISSSALTAGAQIQNISGSSVYAGPISLGFNLTVTNAAGSLELSGPISESVANRSLNKTGAGTLILSGSNSFGSDLTLWGGSLGIGHNNGVGLGTLSMITGGTSVFAAGGSRTVTNSFTFDDITIGGTNALTLSGNASMSGNANKTLTITNAAATLISGATMQIGAVNTTGSRSLTLNVTNGSTATISAAISGSISSGTSSITKAGAGTLVLNGNNTHNGNTAVNNGLLELGTNGVLNFTIGGSGTNNAVTGAGRALFRGTFNFNLAGASTNNGDSWTIASVTTRTYDGNFAVTGFTNSGGVWSRGTNGVTYQFAQSNSVLSVTTNAPAGNYAGWVSYWAGVYTNFTNTAGTADPDGDLFDNNEEFAFDGNPMVGTPALLSVTKLGTNAIFRWVERKAPPGGVTYAVQGTVNLTNGPWTNTTGLTISNSLDQSGINLTNDYIRKEFVIPASGSNMTRIRASIVP